MCIKELQSLCANDSGMMKCSRSKTAAGKASARASHTQTWLTRSETRLYSAAPGNPAHTTATTTDTTTSFSHASMLLAAADCCCDVIGSEFFVTHAYTHA